MKIDLIKDKKVKGIFLLTVTEDLDISAKTNTEFDVNGKEVSFENFINAINENFNIMLDKRVNQLVNEKINMVINKLDEIRKYI